MPRPIRGYGRNKSTIKLTNLASPIKKDRLVSDVTGTELRALMAHVPSVEQVMASDGFVALAEEFGRTQVLATLRGALDGWRAAALAGCASVGALDLPALTASVEQNLRERNRAKFRKVFNLTGTVLHTNLGRALLPDAAVSAVVAALTRPANLEFNLETGKRGDRDDLIDELICELTGAEAATVVNNNAAAVLLTLSALAPKKEVIVSRGELVEIGGAFRIPDIMMRAGAKLREVGTTNRTHLKDYDGLSVRDRVAHESAHEQLRHQRLHQGGDGRGAGAALEGAQRAMAVDLGSGTLVDSRNGGCRVKRPCAKRSPPVRISSRSAATSCSAVRRPA